MPDIDRLINPGSPVFDPDSMTRDLLVSRLKSFFEAPFVAVHSLSEIRSLVRDLAGVNAVEKSIVLPPHLRRMSSVNYTDFSRVNRKEVLIMVMAYLELDDKSGPDLIGSANWVQVRVWMEDKINLASGDGGISLSMRPDSSSAEAVPREVAEDGLVWSRKALSNGITSLLKENHRMLAGDVERVRYSINKLREALNLEPVGQSVHDVGFGALSSVRESNLAPEVMAQVPQSILEALGLDAKSGPQVLGQEAWADVQGQFAKGWVGGAPLWSKSPSKDDASGASEHAPDAETVAEDQGGVLSRFLWSPIKRFFYP